MAKGNKQQQRSLREKSLDYESDAGGTSEGQKGLFCAMVSVPSIILLMYIFGAFGIEVVDGKIVRDGWDDFFIMGAFFDTFFTLMFITMFMK